MLDGKRLSSSLLPAATLVFLATWLALLVVGPRQLFDDPDTLWHIAAGEKVLSSGKLLRADPFSFAPENQPWIAQSWLAECLLAALYRAGGFDTLSLAAVTWLAAFYAWMAGRMLRLGRHVSVAVLLTSLAFIGGASQFLVRPLLFSMVLVGWTFAQLCDFEAGRISLGRLYGMLPVFVLWANMHGGLLAGIAILVMAVVGWGAFRLLGRDPSLPEGRQWLLLAGLVAAACATSLINPYGVQLPRVWLSLASSAVLPRYIQEHAPLPLATPKGIIVVTIGVIYLAALAGTLPRRPRVTWLIPAFWLVASFLRARHGTLFSTTAAIALAEMLPHVRWVQWLIRRGSQLLRPQPPPAGPAAWWDVRRWLIPAALVSVCFCLQVSGIRASVFGRGWVDLGIVEYYPFDFLGDIARLAAQGRSQKRVFNDYKFGGFLILFAPEVKVFIDGRCELYGEQRLAEIFDAERDDPARLEVWADRYDIGLALVDPDSRFDAYLRSAAGWTPIRASSQAALYGRAEHGTGD